MAQASPQLVYQEKDDAFFLHLKKTKDGRYLSICSNAKATAEIQLIDASVAPPVQSRPSLQMIQPRIAGFEYYVEHCAGYLYILHNQGVSGPDNYDLSRVPVEGDLSSSGRREHWQLLVPGEAGRVIEDMDVFEKHIVLYTKNGGQPEIGVMRALNRVADADNSKVVVDYISDFHSRSGTCLLQPGINAAFDVDTINYSLQSPIERPQHFRLDLESGTSSLLSATTVKNFVPDSFQCELLRVESHDSTLVPLTVVYDNNQLRRDGSNPLLLRGYGAYGDSLQPEFEQDVFALVEQGWVIATAHVRGGGELGRQWYRLGRQMKKWNSIHDFIACAKFLVANGFTSHDQLTAEGISAGGMVVAAAANVQPDLFAALSLRAPFVGVLAAMMDPTRPLTIHEYEEWGNPQQSAEVFDYISSYCPLTNLVADNHALTTSDTSAAQSKSSFPAVLATISVDDPRVEFDEVAAYVAAVRERHQLLNQTDRLALLHTHGVFGHSATAGSVCVLHVFVLKTLVRHDVNAPNE